MTAAARYVPTGWECVGPTWARSHERLGAILGRAKADVEAAGLTWVDPAIEQGGAGLFLVVWESRDKVAFSARPEGATAYVWNDCELTARGAVDEDWAAAAVVRWHRRMQANGEGA